VGKTELLGPDFPDKKEIHLHLRACKTKKEAAAAGGKVVSFYAARGGGKEKRGRENGEHDVGDRGRGKGFPDRTVDDKKGRVPTETPSGGGKREKGQKTDFSLPVEKKRLYRGWRGDRRRGGVPPLKSTEKRNEKKSHAGWRCHGEREGRPA